MSSLRSDNQLWQTLPTVLLSIVLSFINPKCLLLNCKVVCCQWRHTRVIWNALVVRRGTIELLRLLDACEPLRVEALDMRSLFCLCRRRELPSACDMLLSSIADDISRLSSLRRLELCHVTDCQIETVAHLSRLQELKVHKCFMSDFGLLHLANLQELKSLTLVRAPHVTDESMGKLSGMHRLESVAFGFCINLTDKGIYRLLGLPILKSLTLSSCPELTGHGLRLEPHVGVSVLTSLSVRSCEYFGIAGLGLLEHLPQLRCLDLAYTKATNARMDEVARFTSLESIDLSCDTAINDASISFVALLPSLKRFVLDPRVSSRLTDDGLRHFSACHLLEDLTLLCTIETKKGFAPLSLLPVLHRLTLGTSNHVAFDNCQFRALKDLRCVGLNDHQLKCISSLQTLQHLHFLSYFHLTSEGLQNLSNMPALSTLRFQQSPNDPGWLTDEHLQHLSSCHVLNSVTFDTCGSITGAGLEHLVDLPLLHFVGFIRCRRLSDDGLKNIWRLRALQTLSIRSCASVSHECKKTLYDVLLSEDHL